MSIQAVLSRIDVIAQAQQQLASPVGSSGAANAAAIGATLSGTTGTGTSTNFASALAQAQGTGGSAVATPTGLTAAGTAGTASAATGLSTGDAASTTGVVPGAVVPQTAWNPEHKPIAGWISPVLDWASQHGWTGTVTSGYRDYSQQASINASGAFSAPAGKSNHETTQYPGGAVDVTDPAQLIQVLKGYTGPYKLVGGVLGPADPEHFSATGH